MIYYLGNPKKGWKKGFLGTNNAVSNSEDFPRKPSLDKTQGSNSMTSEEKIYSAKFL